MTSQDIKAVLTKMQDDICKGDLDAVYPYLADDYVFHRTPLPDTIGKEADRPIKCLPAYFFCMDRQV